MNKSDLIDVVAKRTGYTKISVKAALDTAFVVIAETLASGEKVQILDFGTFDVRERKQRVGRNPGTNEQITIPPTKIAFFKAGRGLKARVVR